MKIGEIQKNYDGENWLYMPEKHKTVGKDKCRTFTFGVAEQGVLENHLDDGNGMPVFRSRRQKQFSVNS